VVLVSSITFHTIHVLVLTLAMSDRILSRIVGNIYVKLLAVFMHCCKIIQKPYWNYKYKRMQPNP